MAASKSKSKVKETGFPKAGIDVVEHELTVDVLRIDGKQKRKLEELVFKGRMTLRRRNPVKVERGKDAGKNKIEFDVLTWVAAAYSKKLQTEILYILSDDAKQKPSMIISEKLDRDFPAEFIFNVTFDARANNKTIKRRHHGRPHGQGFLTVPPSGNRRTSPTITKFEDSFVELKHPEYGLLRFVPRQCNDQDGKTVAALKE